MPRSRHGSQPPSRSTSRPGSRPSSMLSTALPLPPAVQSLGHDLILHLTGLDPDEDEENFGICEDFFTSNMLYHQFLDPREKDVNRKFEGVTEKLIVQAKTRKSKRLSNLWKSINSSPIFDPDFYQHDQHDVKIRLLYLLLLLSNADHTNDDYEGSLEVEICKTEENASDRVERWEKEVLEWKVILNEGERPFRFPQNDSGLSEWSDDEQEFAPTPVVSQSVPHLKKDTRLLGCKEPLKPPSKIPPPGTIFDVNTEESRAKITSSILPHYWVKERDGKINVFPVKVTAENLSANLVNHLNNFHFRHGIPLTDKTLLSEYQVVREILLTFRSPVTCNDSPLFSYDNNNERFSPNRGICIPSLTPETLQTSLRSICVALSSKRNLDYFIDQVLDCRLDSPHPSPPLTFEAYAEALSNFLRIFSADLTRIEQKVRSSKETYTFLDIQIDLRDWFRILNSLSEFKRKAILDPKLKEGYNWQAAIVLLASLHEAIDTERRSDMYAIYVDLFLKSSAPFFHIIGLWVSQGRLEDWRDEFVFAVNPTFHSNLMKLSATNKTGSRYGESAVSSHEMEGLDFALRETFWTRGFISRPYEQVLTALGISVPDMFKRVFPRILCCGKSIEILAILQKQGKLEKKTSMEFKRHVSIGQIYQQFLENLMDSLKMYKTQPGCENGKLRNGNKLGRPSLKVFDFIPEDEDFDPCLVEAFNVVLTGISGGNDVDVNEEESRIVNVHGEFLLSDYPLDPLNPLTDKLSYSLVPIIEQHFDHASKHLLHLFINTLKLEDHISWIRRVFLMEAGDLLSEFYTRVFQLNPMEDLDSNSLTMLLRDCLKYEVMSKRFTVHVVSANLDQDPLDTLSLKFDVDWPLNIVFHSSSLFTYNQVFQFLLKIRRALWCLHQIDARELSTSLENGKRFVEGLKRNGEEFLLNESVTNTSATSRISFSTKFRSSEAVNSLLSGDVEDNSKKVHRVLLLKCWLLSFVSNVHSFIMTRVVHSTEFELTNSLAAHRRCGDNSLDGIVAAHDRFVESIYDRCLLHPSGAVLREAVLKTIGTCLTLHSACAKIVEEFKDDQDLELTLERKQSRCALLKQQKSLLINDRTLSSLEESYSRCHRFLATTLQAMLRNRNLPHLEGLASSLIHSFPTCYMTTGT